MRTHENYNRHVFHKTSIRTTIFSLPIFLFICLTTQHADAQLTSIDLGTLGGTQSEARGVNDLGHVVGNSETSSGEQHAFLWKDLNNNSQNDVGEMIDLGTLGGNFSDAWDGNELGQVVGSSINASGNTRAFLWSSQLGMIDLGTFGGNSSEARAINIHGQVVGVSETTSGEQHAFIWTDLNNNGQNDVGEMIDLGTLGGNNSEARGINNHGWVVGSSDFSSEFASGYRLAPTGWHQ